MRRLYDKDDFSWIAPLKQVKQHLIERSVLSKWRTHDPGAANPTETVALGALSVDSSVTCYVDGTDVLSTATGDRGSIFTGATVSNTAASSIALAHNAPYAYAIYDDAGKVISRTSPDGGSTWGVAIDVQGTAGASQPKASVSYSNGIVWVTYVDADGTAIRLKRSSDNGATYGSEIDVLTGGGGLESALVHAVDDQEAHVLYVDGSSGLMHTTTTDGGTTWSAPAVVNADGTGKQQLVIDSAGDLFSIHINGSGDLVVYRSQNSGATWAFDATVQAAVSNVPFGAFIDGNDTIYVQVIAATSQVESRASTSFGGAFTVVKAIPDMDNALGGDMDSADGKNIYLAYVRSDETLGIAQRREVLSIKGKFDSTEEL